MIYKIFLSAFIGFFSTLSFAADIYKYVDKNGTTYYSDKKPDADIPDEQIDTLTIIESDKINPKSNWKRADHIRKQQASNFEDFFIATPRNNSNFTITDGNLLVMVNLNKDLSPDYRIKFYLDGIQRGRVKSSTQLIGDTNEGPHTLYAEVINATTRQVIKTTPEINFNLIFRKK